MDREIRIGTSGFDYPEWRGFFYPADLDRKQFLSWYAERFDTLELNFSYYRMPDERQLHAFIGKTGPSCLFSIKAHQSLTHEIVEGEWEEALAKFRSALFPLQNSGQLGAVLFQFPSSFHYEPSRRRYLDALLKRAEGLPAVVEFRNHDWYNNRVTTALRDRGVALAAVDLPDLPGLPPAMDLVTADLAYVRFHGRNEKTWWGSDAATRYDYHYSEEELRSWIPRLEAMETRAKRILVYFNNHWRGQAPDNAASLKKLLGQEGLFT